MKILVFGASGGVGQQVVKQGLQKGYTISAFVRNRTTIKPQKDLSIIQGNVLNDKSVFDAIQGHDVIISALGNKTNDALWKPNTIISNGLQHIIQGMERHAVKRLLFVASFGVNDNIFWPEKLLIKLLLKNLFADIPLQEKYIKQSSLQWTIVHPARLENTSKKGKYAIGENLYIGPFSKISRADVADFLLNTIVDKTTFHKTFTISY